MNFSEKTFVPHEELQKKISTKEPSQIPLQKPVETKPELLDLYKLNSTIWQRTSEELLSDYKTGWNLGKYGSGEKVSTEDFLNRLSTAIITSTTQQCNKEGKSTEIFASHFAIIKSVITLIAKDLHAMKLAKMDPRSLVAIIHGFIDSYISQKVVEEDHQILKHGK